MSRNVLISGGTSGIGFATAARFLLAGDNVMLLGRNEARGAKAIADLQASNPSGKVFYLQADVRHPKTCQRAVMKTIEKLDGLNILINSAGIYFEKTLEETTEIMYEALMSTNVKGLYFLTQAAMPHLKESRGCVLNVASDAGVHGNYFCTAYCASKGAVVLFTRALALEVARFGVRVNAICPGDVLTPMTKKQVANAPSEELALKELASIYPLGRIGTPEEMAEVLFFLASDKASFVTGSCWGIDGGLTA